MYEELIKNLRVCSQCDFGQDCNGCTQKSDDAFCCDKLLHQAVDAIEELQKRKHGKWIMKEVITGEFGRLIVCQCSKCKKNQTFQTMYCSNCGAEMEFDKGWYGRCMTN